jgi:rhamnosyltransferase
VLFRHKSLVDQSSTNPLNSFFSDVNSAARRELLVGKVPFRQINYAEDQALAKDMQAKGFIKAYSPSGAVRHSNDYTFTQYFQRKFDEYIGLQDSVGFKVGRSTKSLLLGWIRPTILDWRFIYHDREYKPLSKLVWSIESPFYNLADKAGQFYALKYYGNQKKRSKLSLERKLRA